MTEELESMQTAGIREGTVWSERRADSRNEKDCSQVSMSSLQTLRSIIQVAQGRLKEGYGGRGLQWEDIGGRSMVETVGVLADLDSAVLRHLLGMIPRE